MVTVTCFNCVVVLLLVLSPYISNGQVAVTQISNGTVWIDDYNYVDDCYDTTTYAEHWCTSHALSFGTIGDITTISPENGQFHGWMSKSKTSAMKMTRYFSCTTNSNAIITWDVYWNCCYDAEDNIYYYPMDQSAVSIEYESNSAGNLIVTPSSGAFPSIIESTAPCGNNPHNNGDDLQKSSYEDRYYFQSVKANETFSIQFSFDLASGYVYHYGNAALDNLQVECVTDITDASINDSHSPTTPAKQSTIPSQTDVSITPAPTTDVSVTPAPTIDDSTASVPTTGGSFHSFETCIYRYNLFHGVGDFSINYDVTNKKLQIKIEGPNTEWFALGFGHKEMDKTYAITISLDAFVVDERSLGDHVGGSILTTKSNIEIEENLSEREVVITRDWFDGVDGSYDFTDYFECTVDSMDIIWAFGYDLNFGHHQYKGNGSLSCRCGHGNMTTTLVKADSAIILNIQFTVLFVISIVINY